jgi:hypothetical protein
MRPYRIATVGLSDRERLLLRSLVRLVEHRLGSAWEVYDEQGGEAEVVVIAPQGAGPWEDLEAGVLPAIAVACAQQAPEGARWVLHKPIRAAELIALLERLGEHLGAPPPEARQAAPAGAFRPGEYLPGLLDTGAVAGNVFRFALPDGPGVLVDPVSGVFYSKASLAALAPLLRASAHTIQVSPLLGAHLQRELEVRRLQPRPLESLVFAAVAAASRGRVLEGRQADAPAHLKRWPDFMHLPRRPGHLRLAAYLSRYAATVAQAARVTGVPLSEVVDFVNACAVTGLLDEEGEPQARAAGAGPSAARRSLYRRILGRLGVADR